MHRQLFDLSGRTAIITGAAAGIGRSTAIALYNRGARVAIVDENGCGARSLASRLSNECGRALAFEGDAASEIDISRLADEIIRSLGPVSILVNSAARFVMKGLDATEEDWLPSLRANVAAYAWWAKAVVPQMYALEYGAIVNVCSISAHVAQPGFLTYSAAKGAVRTMTKCMALDLAPRVRVNCVSPGTIWTESNANWIKKKYGVDRRNANVDASIGGQHVLGRCGEPFEIANAIAFLCSEEASFITGADLLVDGGYTLR